MSQPFGLGIMRGGSPFPPYDRSERSQDSMAARPGGYASKTEQARRLATLRELWPTDRTLDQLGERLGLAPTTVSHMARDAGLPPRHVRDRKKQLIS